jgi:hypothetical protein
LSVWRSLAGVIPNLLFFPKTGRKNPDDTDAHSSVNLPVNDRDAVRSKVNEVRRWAGQTALAESD